MELGITRNHFNETFKKLKDHIGKADYSIVSYAEIGASFQQ